MPSSVSTAALAIALAGALLVGCRAANDATARTRATGPSASLEFGVCACDAHACPADRQCASVAGACACTAAYVSLSAAWSTVCAIRADHTLWCWGDNQRGQLGDGTLEPSPTPREVQPLGGPSSDWVQVSVGSDREEPTSLSVDHHACAVRADGTLWCWGANDAGQVAPVPDRTLPQPRPVGPFIDWVAVSAGGTHTCGLRANGSIWCWGSNSHGQLGRPTNVARTGRVPLQVGVDLDWVAVSAGRRHTCGHKRDGRVFCWNGTPTQVGEDADWKEVRASADQTCGIKHDGTLWCWGDRPRRVGTESNWAALGTGSGGTTLCAVRADGSAGCWGFARLGSLGDGRVYASETVAEPTVVSDYGDFRAVAAGHGFGCGLRAGGAVVCWGENREGQLGNGGGAAQPLPSLAPGGDWSALAAGFTVSCGIRLGELYCWGGDSHRGLLGVSADPLPVDARPPADERFFALPARVGDASDWLRVSSFGEHVCGLRGDGTAWCWGSNEFGQLGIGSHGFDEIRNRPVQIGVESDWVDVSAGSWVTCGIRRDGTLWCWGWNATGEIGQVPNGDFYDIHPAPVRVGADADWQQVQVGLSHVCARRRDDTLWCWGSNQGGALGQGTIGGHSHVPLQVGTDADWTAFAVGGAFTCGVRAGGRLYCWGYNLYGGVGDGTRIHRPTPTPLPGDGWTSVASNHDHSCASRADGTLWCWGGDNHLGQLGDGTRAPRTEPVQVAGDGAQDWLSPAVGWVHSCGLRRDGRLACFGANFWGQVGDGRGFARRPGALRD